MSKNIDERIVRMQFDNKQFESGVSESLSTLDKLKQALKFGDVSKSLNDVNNASKKLTFDSLADSIDKISSKFSALGIMGVTVLQRIANQAIDTGEQLVKSLSIDQIMAGWEKYNNATANVQTLMNATGKSEEEVYKYLQQLMWYSDETSYGFTDMTSALATMTSTGGDIEDLIPLLEGVANATAYAGKGAAEYSRIMQYAITQAYSANALTYTDWKIIQNADVGSVQLQQALIDAGEELGTIKKGLVTVKNFAASIQAIRAKDVGVDYKWITPEVMEKAFGSFSKVTEEIYKGVQSGQFETYADGVDAIGNKYGEVALRAAKSAQEAKTLTEAIDATKDAVSSGWMTTFEIIFGRYEEATKRWTQLCNDELWQIFASSAKTRNDILTAWAEEGGSDALWQGIINIFEAIKTVLNPLKEAFAEVFNFGSVEEGRDTLLKLTDSFVKFTEKLILSGDQMDKLKAIFEGVFSIIKIGIDICKGAITVIAGVAKAIWSIAKEPITACLSAIGQWIEGIKKAIEQSEILTKSADFVKDKFQDIAIILKEKARSIKDSIEDAFDRTKEFAIIVVFEKLKNALEKVWNVIKEIATKIKTTFIEIATKIKTTFIEMFEIIKKTLENSDLKTVFNNILKASSIAALTSAISTIIGSLKSVTDSVKDFTGGISEILNVVKGFFKGISDIGSSIKNVLDTVKSSLVTWQNDVKADMILKIAEALGILALALIALSSLDYDELCNALSAITGLIIDLVAAMVMLSKLDFASKFDFKNKTFNFGGAASEMIKLASAVLLLAVALKKIGTLKPEQLGLAFITIIGLMASLVKVVKNLNTEGDLTKVSAGLVVFGAAMVVMAEAVGKFADMNIKELGIGLLGFFSVLVLVVGVAHNMPNSAGDLIEISAGLILLAEALKIMADVVKTLGSSTIEGLTELSTGLVAVMALLVTLAAFVVATKKCSQDLIKLGVGMIALGAALVVIAKAVEMISEIDMGLLTKSLIAVAVLLEEIVLAVHLMEDNVAGAGAMLLVAAALLVLAASLKIISQINREALDAALAAITVGLIAFVAAAYAASPVIEIMAALAAEILILAAATVVAGVGIKLIGTGLTALSVGLMALCDAIVIAAATIVKTFDILLIGIITIITNMRIAIIEGFTNIIISIITSIGNIITAISTVVSNVMSSIVSIIVNAIQEIGSLDFGILVQGLIGLAAAIGVFIAAGYLAAPVIPILFALSAALLTFGLALDAITLAMGLAIAGIIALCVYFPQLGEKVKQLGENIKTFGECIKETLSNFIEHVKQWFESIGNFFGDIWAKVTDFGSRLISFANDLGGNVMKGIAAGIAGAMDMLMNTVSKIASKIKAKFCSELEIHSPSKVFARYGAYIDAGLAKGINDEITGVESSISTVANSLTSSFDNSYKEFYNLGSSLGNSLAYGMEETANSATITPVIDLDQSTSRNLNSVASITESIKDALSSISDINTEQTINEHVTFDTLTIKGVNNEDEFVATADYAVDEIISSLLRREARI